MPSSSPALTSCVVKMGTELAGECWVLPGAAISGLPCPLFLPPRCQHGTGLRWVLKRCPPLSLFIISAGSLRPSFISGSFYGIPVPGAVRGM